jgi:hypothetical protein
MLTITFAYYSYISYNVRFYVIFSVSVLCKCVCVVLLHNLLWIMTTDFRNHSWQLTLFHIRMPLAGMLWIDEICVCVCVCVCVRACSFAFNKIVASNGPDSSLWNSCNLKSMASSRPSFPRSISYYIPIFAYIFQMTLSLLPSKWKCCFYLFYLVCVCVCVCVCDIFSGRNVQFVQLFSCEFVLFAVLLFEILPFFWGGLVT